MMTTQQIKAFFEKIKVTLVQSFYLILAVLLLSLLIYLRFLPRTARDLWDTLTTLRLVIMLFTIIILVLNMYSTAKTMGLLPKRKTFPIFETIKIRFAEYYALFLDLFKNLYDFFWYLLEQLSKRFFNYPYLQYSIIRLLVKSFNNPKHFPYYFAFLLYMTIVPRIIFVLVFFHEACFLKYLNITFFFMPFLLLLYLEDIFLFVIKDFYRAHFKGLCSFITQVRTTTTVSFYYNPAFRNQYPLGTKSDEDFLVNHFEIARKIPETLQKYEETKHFQQHFNSLLFCLQYLRLLTYLFIMYYAILTLYVFK